MCLEFGSGSFFPGNLVSTVLTVCMIILNLSKIKIGGCTIRVLNLDR